ncbi:hypothetical protein BKA82DRAFT_771875 [Pisolithus tinctorius]|uniref:Uncharacterized protein n=1 Tax=Pisolithus tinctorius Marx 270 TaxID=870435 RepID=A0A0C3JRT5_PISTI|nr:hypothetical protein BKA82DRAFT_771875 [Pisolithus tinctorius]KIO00197.1 hypothetical protein M404DRAFT_771875 [Pisolithus tinctorius Marx 270]
MFLKMWLLNVKAVLDREESAEGATSKVGILERRDHRTTKYAILSHRWESNSEVGYREMAELMEMEEWKRDEVKKREGYRKIIKSCERAKKDGYKWLWIDTCCIERQSSTELSESINSMYRWYQHSGVCYAYLHDVETTFPMKQDKSRFSKSNGWPEWFMRGWTLQELIAPSEIQFFNRGWVYIGSKRELASTLEDVTRVPGDVLRNGLTSQPRPSVAQIVSWAADRVTTRVEDRAYSLLGLFGVNIPMVYGEGEKAFRRLQLEIIKDSNDQSIFAWDPYGRMPRHGSVLADDPSYFRDCRDVERLESERFVSSLKEFIRRHELATTTIESEPALRRTAEHISVFAVTNAGIQMSLPLIPYRNSTSFKAILACHNRVGNLITIDLTPRGSAFDRSRIRAAEICRVYPHFRQLYLTCSREAIHYLTLDDKVTSYHGFVRCGTFPRNLTGDVVTLSSENDDCIVIVYANDDARSRFAVGLGYCLGKGWVHIISPVIAEEHWMTWTDFARRARDMMRGASIELVKDIHKHDESLCDNFIKHAHLPRSIWAARVAWGRWNENDLKIVIDIKQCFGCCIGPREWVPASNDRNVEVDCYPGVFGLEFDRKCVWLDKCSCPKIAI